MNIKLAFAFAAMILSTLCEGIYGCFFKGNPPFTKHQALMNGIMNTIFVISYWWGFWIWTQRDKNNEN